MTLEEGPGEDDLTPTPPEKFADLLNRAVAMSASPDGGPWDHKSLATAMSALGVGTFSPSTVKSHLYGIAPEPKRLVVWSYSQVLKMPYRYWFDPRVTAQIDADAARVSRQRNERD